MKNDLHETGIAIRNSFGDYEIGCIKCKCKGIIYKSFSKKKNEINWEKKKCEKEKK